MAKKLGTKSATRKSSKKSPDLPNISGPGVAPVSIPEIDELAQDYFEEKERRCKMTPREIAAKNKLIDAMHAHEKEIGRNDKGELRYQYDDVVVLLKPGKEILKVKEVDAFEEENVT